MSRDRDRLPVPDGVHYQSYADGYRAGRLDAIDGYDYDGSTAIQIVSNRFLVPMRSIRGFLNAVADRRLGDGDVIAEHGGVRITVGDLRDLMRAMGWSDDRG